jgi:hypothetical protein
MLRRAIISVAVGGLMLPLIGLVNSPSALAGGKCVTIDKQTRRCAVYADQPAESDPDRTSTKLDLPKSRATKCKIGDAVIPCRTGNGVWSDRFQCYVKRMSNQPPKSDPDWEGHKNGALYWCTAPDDQDSMIVWLPSTPGLPPPDPRTLAWRAIASMDLHAIKIGIVPEDKPGRIGLVGLPTWLWVADRGPSTWGPITRSASERGYSVSATARVERVVWAMGDGEVVVCRKPGIPYAARFGKRSSPECGYRYTEQGRYTVRAASYWVVSWRGMGQSGEIRFQLTADTRIAVGELQLIRTR